MPVKCQHSHMKLVLTLEHFKAEQSGTHLWSLM